MCRGFATCGSQVRSNCGSTTRHKQRASSSAGRAMGSGGGAGPERCSGAWLPEGSVGCAAQKSSEPFGVDRYWLSTVWLHLRGDRPPSRTRSVAGSRVTPKRPPDPRRGLVSHIAYLTGDNSNFMGRGPRVARLTQAGQRDTNRSIRRGEHRRSRGCLHRRIRTFVASASLVASCAGLPWRGQTPTPAWVIPCRVAVRRGRPTWHSGCVAQSTEASSPSRPDCAWSRLPWPSPTPSAAAPSGGAPALGVGEGRAGAPGVGRLPTRGRGRGAELPMASLHASSEPREMP